MHLCVLPCHLFLLLRVSCSVLEQITGIPIDVKQRNCMDSILAFHEQKYTFLFHYYSVYNLTSIISCTKNVSYAFYIFIIFSEYIHDVKSSATIIMQLVVFRHGSGNYMGGTYTVMHILWLIKYCPSKHKEL